MFPAKEISSSRSHSMEGDAAIAGVSLQSVGTASGVGQVTTPGGNSAIEQEIRQETKESLERGAAEGLNSGLQGDEDGEMEHADSLGELESDRMRQRKVCILSMDGGGIRGLIPARILSRLEEFLREKSGDPSVHIADFFDLVAGTSTGGLLAVLLTTPNKEGKPVMTAKKCVEFYKDHGAYIFAQRWFDFFGGNVRQIWRPKYKAYRLEKLLKGLLYHGKKALTLADSLKPILVTSFDISNAVPFFFVTHAAKQDESRNFRLWQVCRATSAAPTFFPPAQVDSVDNMVHVTLIDGGAVQNNPTLVAVTHALGNKDDFPDRHTLKDCLILSLGAGQLDEKHTFQKARKWGMVNWVRPLINIMMDGTGDTVDYQIAATCAGQKCSENYLRMQVSGLSKRAAELDCALEGNVRELVDITDALLGQKATRRNIFGERETLDKTNEECLEEFADKLVAERKGRLDYRPEDKLDRMVQKIHRAQAAVDADSNFDLHRFHNATRRVISPLLAHIQNHPEGALLSGGSGNILTKAASVKY